MDNRTDYYLLLADIQGSSVLSARQAESLMMHLLPALERENLHHSAEISYPMEVNYGDEFAGLFTTPGPLYQIVSNLRHALKGIARFRFVVVHGRIGYAGGSIREMGGPVFESASHALDSLKKSRQSSRWIIGDEATDLSLTALSNAASSLIADMTDYQYAVFRLHQEGMKGVDIAEQLGKDARSVSNAKKGGHSKTVIDIEAALNAILTSLAAHRASTHG